MTDALKLALRISAIDLFSGVLRRFRSEIAGSSAAAQAMQERYDRMLNHTAAGLKSLAVGGYLAGKLKPAVSAAADMQESLLSVASILQGAHPNAAKLADQMKRVRDNAVEVASHTKFSATAVTDVTRQLVQGGVPLDAILDRVNGKGAPVRGTAFNVEVLAETQDADPATTARNIANVGHSFQLTPDQYADAVDVIARGAVTSSGTLDQLFHNLDQVGSRAHMYGNMDLKSTVVALKALAPLGDEAGSDLGEALARLTGGSYRGRKWMKESGFDFYDKQGGFIGLDASLQQIKKRISTMTPEHRNEMLGLLFGQTGGKAITQLLAPSLPNVKSYWEIKDSIDQQASLKQQNDKVMTGLNMSAQSLASTNQTTLAAMFDPMLGKMTQAIKLANRLSGAVGEISSKHRWVADTASVGGGLAVGAAGAYGLYRLIRAAGSGAGVLRQVLGGTGSLAAGVAEGKALEKVTGVVPVFVTNFPGALGGAGTVAEAAAKATTAGAADASAATIAARIGARGFALTDLLPAVAGGIAIQAINKSLSPVASSIDAVAAKSAVAGQAARYGLSPAQVALRNQIELNEMPYGRWHDQHAKQYKWYQNDFGDYEAWLNQEVRRRTSQGSKATQGGMQVGGTIRIQIDQQGRAAVKQLRSDNPNVHLDVGTMMSVP